MSKFIDSPLHIFMPFSRSHLINELTQRYNKPNVALHPLCSSKVEADKWPKVSHVVPYVLTPPEKVFDPCYWKLEQARLTIDVPDDAYICCVCDDDMIGDIEKLSDETADIIFVTMHRGYRCASVEDNGTPEWTPPSPAIEGGIGHFPLNCAIGGSFQRANVWKTIPWRQDIHQADGERMKQLELSEFTKSYRPDVNLLWNYFQPGRWNAPSIDETVPYVPLS